MREKTFREHFHSLWRLPEAENTSKIEHNFDINADKTIEPNALLHVRDVPALKKQPSQTSKVSKMTKSNWVS